MRASATAACVLLVLFAGCAGVQDAPSTPEPTATAAPAPGTPTPTETAMGTPSPTATSLPTAAPTPTTTSASTPPVTETESVTRPGNPWNTYNVSVSINDETDSDRDFERPVDEALAYWNENHANYTVYYGITFSLEPELPEHEADLTIHATDSIEDCGGPGEDDLLIGGCLRDDDDIDVIADQNNLQFEITAIHELGHALDLDHTDSPRWVMANPDTEATGTLTDARNRTNPWNTTETLGVAIGDSLSGESYQSEVESAVDYYNRNDHHLPEGLQLASVDQEHDAHIVIEDSSETNTELDRGGSVPFVEGLDYDSDDAFEQYTGATVYLNDIPAHDSELHIGHWIGILVGNSEDELPSRYSP